MSTPEPPAGEDPRLLELALRVADGDAVEWARTRETASDLEDTIDRLHEVEAISSAFRAGAPEPAPAPVETAFTWGPLQVRDRLGHGAFGEVWRAWDPALQREVALKLAHRDGRTRARWLDEARRLARVRHPHVVTVYGADVHDGRAGLWMDLVRGRTLEQILREQGPLGAREAAGIGMDLCGALAAVHAAGLVHGDVKATNVMREGLAPASPADSVAGSGHVRLMDFGSAREPSSPAAEGAHTPLYAAPERLAGGVPDARGDVYALGVLLFRLVTGRFPVEAATEKELRERLARGETLSLRALRPDLPPAFVRAVERAMAPDPAQRFADAAHLERALAAVAGEGPPVARASRSRWLSFAAGIAAMGGIWMLSILSESWPASGSLERPHPPLVVDVGERFDGAEPGGGYGTSVAVMDLHGDGRPVMLVGAPGESLSAGRVHLLRRDAGGEWREEGVLGGSAPGDGFGYAIADIGDVNGDGWRDLAVSAYMHSTAAGRGTGAVYVYFGGPHFRGAPDVTLEGVTPLGDFGLAIAGIGDVDRDGFADFLVGAPTDERGGRSAGRAFLYRGGRVLSTRPAIEFAPTSPGGQFGVSVAGVGDVNGDGAPDFAIGANWDRSAGHPRGRVNVYFGGHGLHAEPDWTLTGPDESGWFGIVRGVGDVNGDGYDDLVVGAGHGRGSAPDAGAAYVYLGGVHPETRPAVVLRGDRAGDGFGYTVCGAGDLNGDGFQDIAIAGSGSDLTAPSAGEVKFYFGGRNMSGRADAVLAGDAAGDQFGISLCAAGDLDGDGLGDVLVGSCWASHRQRGGGIAWLARFARHRWLRPHAGESVTPGRETELRWLGQAPADVSLSTDHGAHWAVLARSAGGHAENSLRVRVPEGPSGAAQFRLAPSDTALRGVETSPEMRVLQR